MRVLAVILAALLAVPPGLMAAAATTGTVSGTVTVDGRPLSGLDLSLVDLESGAVTRARSGEGGNFEVQVGPGTYVITGGGGVGLSVGRAPAVVRVQAGRVASTSVELMAMASSTLAALQDAGGATINHDAVGCMIAGEFPQLDAVIEPAANVVRARLYFKSSLSDEWYFTEMVLQPDGTFRGWMPRPQVEASPITYYIQATTTDFGETQLPEMEVTVVEDEFDCDDKAIAPTGQPPAGLTVFSAATGAAAVPIGFAAGGALLGVGALVGLGVLLLGGTVVAATTGGDETPTPTPPPTTTLPPTPQPTPTPSVTIVVYSEFGHVPGQDEGLGPSFIAPLGSADAIGGSGSHEIPAGVDAGPSRLRYDFPASEGTPQTKRFRVSINLSASPAKLNVGPKLPGGVAGMLFLGSSGECSCSGSLRATSFDCRVDFEDINADELAEPDTKECVLRFGGQQYDQDGPTIPPFP